MATRLDVVLDDAALNAVRTSVADSPREYYAVVNNVILPKAQQAVAALLNRYPGPVKRPFRFASRKSQGWYFANRKAPHQRNGALLQWKLYLKAFSGQTVDITLENPVPEAQWVFGNDKGKFQQPGHAATGYPLVARVIPALAAGVLNDLSEAWLEQSLIPLNTRS